MRGLGRLAILYLLIGVAIYAVQSTTGTTCDPQRSTPMVTADQPEGFMRVLLWPVSAYENLWQKGVPLKEYVSPSICVEKS